MKKEKIVQIYPEITNQNQRGLNQHYQLTERNKTALYSAFEYLGDYFKRKYVIEKWDCIPQLTMTKLKQKVLQSEVDGLDYCDYHMNLVLTQKNTEDDVRSMKLNVRMITNQGDLLLILPPNTKQEEFEMPHLQIHLKAIVEKKDYQIPNTQMVHQDCVTYLLELIYENGELCESYIGMDKQMLDILGISYKLRNKTNYGNIDGLLPIRKDDSALLYDVNANLYSIYMNALIDHQMNQISNGGYQKKR